MLLKMIISHYYKVSKYRQLRYICLSTGGVCERERQRERKREREREREAEKRKPEGVSNIDRETESLHIQW